VILAGLVGDPITKKYPESSQAINLDGILQVTRSLNGRGLNRVIFISTCSNYGLIESGVAADETFELNPLSLYAEAKVAVERELLSLQGQVDFHATILRFATAFGLSPRMRFDLTVNEFTREMFLGRELLVYDAETWRPYCHVQDFSRVVDQVLLAPVEQVSFEVFNAGGECNNFNKQSIVDEILRHLPDAPVKYKEKGSDPRNYKVNFSKIRNVLGFKPEYTVSDGVVALISALQQNIFSRVEEQRNFYHNYEIKNF
jgi:nucleoside-diphosphate-sugar epimerase